MTQLSILSTHTLALFLFYYLFIFKALNVYLKVYICLPFFRVYGIRAPF